MKFWILLHKEILEIIRDRRALLSMLIVPLVVIPLIFLVVSVFTTSSMEKIQKARHPVALQPGIPVPGLLEAMPQAGLDPFESDSPRAMVETGRADLGVAWEKTDDGTVKLTAFSDQSSEGSGFAYHAFSGLLDSLRQDAVSKNMESLGAPAWTYKPYSLESVNVAPPSRMAAYFLGMFLGYILVLLIFTGGMYPAMDLVAGERERHTIEILLSAPVGRGTVVAAKITAVALGALVTGLANILSYGLSIIYLGMMSPETASLVSGMPFTPLSISLILLCILPLTLLAASLEVALSSLARSYREAQTYLTPLSLVVIFPAVASMIPGAELTLYSALVPIYNTAMTIKGVLMGDIGALSLVVSLVANAAYAAAATFIAVRAFGREGILKAD